MKLIRKSVLALLLLSVLSICGLGAFADVETRAFTPHSISPGSTMYYWDGDPGSYIFNNSTMTLWAEFDAICSMHTVGYKNAVTGSSQKVSSYYDAQGSYTSMIIRSAGYYRAYIQNNSSSTIKVNKGTVANNA